VSVLADIKSTGRQLPSRVVLHGVEGVGKTSFAASAPSPIFGMSKGETGLETLIDNKQLGEIDHFPEWQSWDEAMTAVRAIAVEEHEYKTLVLDTMNGLERLCFDEVCRKECGGDLEKFNAYGRGSSMAANYWRELLAALDAVRSQKRMAIVCLVHTQVQAYKNPLGDDYDRFVPRMHKNTWGPTHEWADMVLFANFVDVPSKDNGQTRAKGKGGKHRNLFTTRTAGYDAKNRHGLTDSITLGTKASDGWANFVNALKAAKEDA